MSQTRAPRYRVCVYELHDGTTTPVIDTYGSAFITAVATLDDDLLEVHFNEGGPRQLTRHIAEAIAHEYPARRRR